MHTPAHCSVFWSGSAGGWAGVLGSGWWVGWRIQVLWGIVRQAEHRLFWRTSSRVPVLRARDRSCCCSCRGLLFLHLQGQAPQHVMHATTAALPHPPAPKCAGQPADARDALHGGRVTEHSPLLPPLQGTSALAEAVSGREGSKAGRHRPMPYAWHLGGRQACMLVSRQVGWAGMSETRVRTTLYAGTRTPTLTAGLSFGLLLCHGGPDLVGCTQWHCAAHSLQPMQ